MTPHLNHRDSSDEGSQHMVSLRNKKNYPELSLNTLLSRALLVTDYVCLIYRKQYLYKFYRSKTQMAKRFSLRLSMAVKTYYC